MAVVWFWAFLWTSKVSTYFSWMTTSNLFSQVLSSHSWGVLNFISKQSFQYRWWKIRQRLNSPLAPSVSPLSWVIRGNSLVYFHFWDLVKSAVKGKLGESSDLLCLQFTSEARMPKGESTACCYRSVAVVGLWMVEQITWLRWSSGNAPGSEKMYFLQIPQYNHKLTKLVTQFQSFVANYML